MINRLLSFLDASPVNFLAVKNIADSLEAAGFRHLDARQPLGEVKAGDCLFATKNASSIYAFRIGRQPLSEAGFHMICAHSDSPTFRIKPNAEMLTEGGLVKLNTEVYGGPIMSTWFDRPLTLAGRVIVRGDDVMHPITMPKAVTPLITPSYSSPIWSAIYSHFFSSTVARSASAAARSRIEEWSAMISSLSLKGSTSDAFSLGACSHWRSKRCTIKSG